MIIWAFPSTSTIVFEGTIIGSFITQILAVGAGGALGCIARFLTTSLMVKVAGPAFPFGTLLVNVLGSFAMGIFIELALENESVGHHVRLLVAVGALGGFTTFSAFSLEVVALFERGEIVLTAVYILSSVVLSILALVLGLYVVRRGLLGAVG